MNTSWQGHDRTPEQRQRIEAANRIRRIRLWQRIDIALFGWILLLLGIIIGVWLIGVRLADRFGWFDPPRLQPIADERILTNVRDHLADHRLLDAVFHAPDGRIYISQEGGLLHRYQPPTHLWSTEQPFGAGDPILSDFVQLRSGCGAAPTTERAATCPDPDSLWAVSASGGLARRRDGRWQVIVGETRFVGARGIPVDHAELTAAAISADNRWLVLGTKQDGIGVYDIDRHTWLSLSSDLFAVLPSPTISHIVAWRERYWLGGPKGVASLEMRRDNPLIQAETAFTGAVLDLDADPDGSLWVLEQRPCAEAGTGCLYLSQISVPGRQPTVLLDEGNHFTDVNLASLHFAQQVDDRLTLAGRAGIFAYDTIIHHWQRLFDKRVGVILPASDGRNFHFGFPFGVGLAEQSGVNKTWNLPDQQVLELLNGRGSDVLALTEPGNVYSLASSGEVAPVFTADSTALEPARFTHAVALTDTLLFLGPEGGLLHNVRTRSYEDIDQDLLSEWLTDPATRLLNTGDYVFGISEGGTGTASLFPVSSSDLVDSSYFRSRDLIDIQPLAVPGPIRRAWPVDRATAGLLAGDGRIYRAAPDALTPVMGPAAPEMNLTQFLDATADGEDLLVASPSGVRRYDAGSREWGDFEAPPVDREAQDIESFRGDILAVTDRNRLVRMGDAGRARIGDDEGFAISDAALSDALLEGSNLYLAGAGWVERYDTDERRISQRWQVGASADVALIAVIADEPLTLTAANIALGEQSLDTEAGRVVNLAIDERWIWTVRELGGQRYLKGYPISSPFNLASARCFFRHPTAAAAAIMDARLLPAPLPAGTIAAVTNAGLRFYNPTARSWAAGPSDLVASGGRSYVLGQHLILTEAQASGLRLSIIGLDAITLPHSCAAAQATLSAQTFEARAAAVDEAARRIVWLAQDGAVIQWQGGSQTVLLPAVKTGPRQTDLRRAFDRADAGYLLFTTDVGIWRYDLPRRGWTALSLTPGFSASQIDDIDIERNGSSERAIVRTTNGEIYLGDFGAADAAVTLTRLYATPTRTFDAPASALLDVQDRGDGLWTFVLSTGIEYLDPKTRQWLTPAKLPGDDPTLKLYQVMDRAVVVAESGQAWWIAQATGSAPTQFARYPLTATDAAALDQEGAVWRLRADGILMQCEADASAAYQCQQYAPAPFLLDPGLVRNVFEWQGLLIFEMGNGLRAYSPSSHQEVQLPPDAANFGPLLSARTYQNRLWLRAQDALLILGAGSRSSPDALLFRDVRVLIHDAGGLPWARFDAGWRVWDGGNFVEPVSTGLPPVHLFVAEGAKVTAIDEQGFPYTWNDRLQRNDLPLPAEVQPGGVTAMLSGRKNDWWVVSNNRLDHVVRRQCQVIVEPPATAPETSAITDTAATGVITATTPTPTPTIVLTPCLQVSANAVLPPGFGAVALDSLRWARVIADDSIELIGQDGAGLRIAESRPGQLTITNWENASVPVHGQVESRWPALQKNMAQLADGRPAYDPITALDVGLLGGLSAVRPTGAFRLAAKAVLANQIGTLPPSALDAGWLRWDRTQTGFQVATPSGSRLIAKTDFITADGLLFEPVDALLTEGANRYHAANRFGVWVYSRPQLALDDRTITFQPLPLGAAIGAVHGRFLLDAGDLPLNADRIQPALTQATIVTGDLTVDEQVRVRTVDGTVLIGDDSPSAFAASGFIWDSNRRGVAYDEGKVLLQSDAGIQAIGSLSGFDPGPGRLAIATARLRFETGFGPLLQDGNSWQERDGQRWNPVPDPAADRQLLDNSVWTWRLQNSQLQIDLAAPVHRFSNGSAADGFGFNFDRLQVASAYQNRLFVATDAFFEIADSPDALGAMGARRLAPLQVNRIETLRFGDGSTALFSQAEGSVGRWDDGNARFVAVSATDDPYRERSLVESARLRFRKYPATVEKALQVDAVAASPLWVPFQFVDGQFPFDQITALSIFDEALYLASAAGLQIYPDPVATGLGQAQSIFALRDGSGALTPVSALGVPVGNPGMIVAEFGADCLQAATSTSLRPCTQPGLLDSRLLVRNHLWQWVKDRSGMITGQYFDQDARLSSLSAQLVSGRFPHDSMHDAIHCQGRALSLWEANWISVHADAALALSPGVQHFDWRDAELERLVCIEREIPLPGGADIRPGVYIEAADGHLWWWSGADWQPISSETVADGVHDRAERPPIFDGRDLRLLTPVVTPATEPPALVFEHRSLDSAWAVLPWQMGQVVLDQWRGLIYQQDENRLWAATPAGLAAFALDNDGRAVLDPDAVVLISEPAGEDGPCRITDLSEQDSAAFVRCNADSEQVFRGRLDGSRDRNVFQPYVDADPFAERELVDVGYWRWQLAERSGGSEGILQGTWRDEVISLDGGRFGFDTITSLALFRDGMVDFGTSEKGWLQSGRDRFAVVDLQRPKTNNPDPNLIDRVGITRSEDELQLCLHLASNQGYARLAGTGVEQAESCPEYLGDDGLWRFAQDEKAMLIFAPQAIGGASARQLAAGRFPDDVIIGAPAVAGEQESLSYWLPTQAGVLHLGADLGRDGIQAPPFSGLEADAAPSALFMQEPDAPLYLTQAGFHRLDASRSLVTATLDLPAGATPFAIEEDAHSKLFVRWSTAGDRGWSLLDRENLQSNGQNILPIDLSQLPKFVERRIAWGDPTPWLTAHVGVDVVTFLDFDLTRSANIPVSDLHLLRPFVADERLLLIGEQELWQIDLEQAMIETFESSISPQPVSALPPAALLPTVFEVRQTYTPTAMPSLFPTALPLPSATRPPTASPTVLPPPTSAPTPTATSPPPTSTPVPLPLAQVQAAIANLRSGPGTNYDVIGQVKQGVQILITGRSENRDWWEVQNPERGVAWIAGGLVAARSVDNVAVKQAPPTPTPRPTPTPPATVAARPASRPQSVGPWVLVADSFADYPGPNLDRRWWYLWSEGRNNFSWQDMAGGGADQCYQSPNSYGLQICRDSMTINNHGDVALLWKSGQGGSYRFEWDASALAFYRRLQFVGSQGAGTELPYSATFRDLPQWELFFWVARSNSPYHVKVFRLQELQE